jgi:DeoR family fructose operon transcriptional repressor
MTGEKRRRRIFSLLARHTYGSIGSLAEEMRVSPMTIRRDLTQMEGEGLIRRTHGGALAVSDRLGEISLDYGIRTRQNARAKKMIAQAAADKVCEGDVVFLDAGTTVLAMAEFLGGRRAVSVVTHSIPLAERLSGREGISVYLLGGEVRPDLMACVGPRTTEDLQAFCLDKAFLGTGGVDLERGLAHVHSEEVPIKRAAARAAREVFTLADHTKIGHTGLMFFLGPDEAGSLITERKGKVVIEHFSGKKS